MGLPPKLEALIDSLVLGPDAGGMAQDSLRNAFLVSKSQGLRWPSIVAEMDAVLDVEDDAGRRRLLKEALLKLQSAAPQDG